jgi:hypothetical protein
MPIEAFMVFAGKHEAPLHYSVSHLEEDRLTLERLSGTGPIFRVAALTPGVAKLTALSIARTPADHRR